MKETKKRSLIICFSIIAFILGAMGIGLSINGIFDSSPENGQIEEKKDEENTTASSAYDNRRLVFYGAVLSPISNPGIYDGLEGESPPWTEKNNKAAGEVICKYILENAGSHTVNNQDFDESTRIYYTDYTSDSLRITFTASPKSGYKFLGWYFYKGGDGYDYWERKSTSTTWQPHELGSTTANEYIDYVYAVFCIDDKTPPEIHRSTYKYNGDAGYYVYTYVTDNIGVYSVKFPTWTAENGQDDIQTNWGDYTNGVAAGSRGSWTIDGEEYNYRYYVARSSHNNEYGTYFTHIYAYDETGNYLYVPAITVQLGIFVLDINGMIDGGDSADLKNYGTFDLYIDGVKVVSNATDYYNESMTCGQTYEIKNIQVGSDKIYVGVAIGSLSGEMTGNIGVYLEFRTATWEDYAADSYASGSGTEVSPYIIKTPQQMGKLIKESASSDLAGRYYKLGANIDLSAHIWNGIGNETYRFAGNFDGDMYCISGIETSVDYCLHTFSGLFLFLNNSTISNLIMKNCNFKSTCHAGGIAGSAYGSIISNCLLDSVNVTSTNTAGWTSSGITGCITHTEVRSCSYKNGTVQGYHTGGISVIEEGSKVIDCSVINSNVNGTLTGILGYVINGEITSSYGQGTVNNTPYKLMYGDSSVWDNWSYIPSLNGGYPIQKALFHLGGITGSQNVYNYLTATLKFSVA